MQVLGGSFSILADVYLHGMCWKLHLCSVKHDLPRIGFLCSYLQKEVKGPRTGLAQYTFILKHLVIGHNYSKH